MPTSAQPYNRAVPETLDFTVAYEQGQDGWIVAQVLEVPGALSQGRTREEARSNVIDALRLMLTPEESKTTDERETLSFIAT